jgi:hypothetical protein
MKLFTGVFGTALVICGALNAQTMSDRMTVNFPASVVINGATLPAGEATINVLHTSGSVLLAIRSDSGEHASVLVNRLTEAQNTVEPKVILDNKAGVFHLNRVIMTDHTALQVLDLQ